MHPTPPQLLWLRSCPRLSPEPQPRLLPTPPPPPQPFLCPRLKHRPRQPLLCPRLQRRARSSSR
eukprot:9290346-Pyramimonas_sp.AAC.1